MSVETEFEGVPWIERIVPTLAIVAALWWAQAILIPIVLSVLISYALDPLVVRLGACRVPRALAVPLLMAMLLATIGLGTYALGGEAMAFLDRLPSAAHTVSQLVRDATNATPGTIARVQEAAHDLESAASTVTQTSTRDGVTPVRIEEPTLKWSDWFWQGSTGAAAFAAQMCAVICLVYYLLIAGDLYRRKLVRIVPTLSRKKVTVEILAEIDRQIGRFLLARAVISVIVGVMVWLEFRVMGIDDAGFWGVLSAMLFTIPFVGPAVVVVAAMLTALIQFASVGTAVVAGGLCLVIAALEGNVLTPWLMARVSQMNAVAVFVSLLFWGWIWGIWGLLLAVPITAAAAAVCERITELQAYGELLKE